MSMMGNVARVAGRALSVIGLREKAKNIKNEVKFGLNNHALRKPRLYDGKSSERIGVVYDQPSDMCNTDKIMLYALIRGLRPARVLEIGARWGGSAKIITAAMEDNDFGRLVGLDPITKDFRAKPSRLYGRYTLIKGYSPEDTPKAAAEHDGKLDFVFIDALHTHDAVISDFESVVPFLADCAHVLLHDTYHQGINVAVEEILAKYPYLVDCGFVTRNPEIGYPVSYQGLRLIRKGPVEGSRLIGEAYIRAGQETPPFDPKLWNWDAFANSIGKGAI